MQRPVSWIANTGYHPIAIEQIECSDPFLRSLFSNIDAGILEQVREFGMMQPLPVQRAEHGFHLLAGYPYVPVLRHLGYQEVVCQVVPADFPPLVLYAIQILHGLSTVAASPVLQAHLICQAKKILSDTEVLRLVQLMGHKPHQYKVQELLALLTLSPPALLALHQGMLSPKSGKLLARLSDADQQHLVALITLYRPGGSKQQKMIDMVIELALRHNRPINELLHSWQEKQQQEQPQEDAVNLPQQLQGLLRYLHEQCVPTLNDAEKRFQHLVRELDPPPHIHLDHSLSFEDESVEVRLLFADQAALHRHWPVLKKLGVDEKTDVRTDDPGEAAP